MSFQQCPCCDVSENIRGTLSAVKTFCGVTQLLTAYPCSEKTEGTACLCSPPDVLCLTHPPVAVSQPCKSDIWNGGKLAKRQKQRATGLKTPDRHCQGNGVLSASLADGWGKWNRRERDRGRA